MNESLIYNGCRVAVYGTLKKGYQNANHLASAKYLGTTNLPRLGAMFLYGSHLPAVTFEEQISNIKVEVYDTTTEILRDIDILEGHPNFYRREQQYVEPYGFCWVYIMPKYKLETCTHVIKTGDWKGSIASQLAMFRGWGYGADGMRPMWPKTLAETGSPDVREYYSLRSSERDDEFIAVDKHSGERFGPFKHLGWHTGRDGRQKPKVNAAVIASIRAAMSKKGEAVIAALPTPAKPEPEEITFEEHLAGPGGATTF